MKNILVSIFAGLVFFVSSAAAQDFAPINETIDRTFALEPNGKISFEDTNGNLRIESWTQNQVHVVGKKRIEGCRYPRDIRVEFDSTPHKLTIKNIYDDGKFKGKDNYCRAMFIDYTIFVPSNARLTDISTVNGSITAVGAFRQFNASTVNGTLHIKNLSGDAVLETVNGSISADFAVMSNVQAETVNGDIKLSFPSNLDARLDLSTFNGWIKTAFDLPPQPADEDGSGKEVHAVIGKGTAKIKTGTVNGSIMLLDREQGANQNLKTVPARRTQGSAVSVEERKVHKIIADKRFIKETLENYKSRPIKDFSEAAEQIVRKTLAGKELQDALMEIEAARRELDKVLIDGNLENFNNLQIKNSIPFKNSGSLEIKGNQTTIVVRGWEREQISYQMTYAGTETTNDPLKFKSDGNRAVIDISPKLDKNRLTVYVPRKTDLKIISHGDISLENIDGKVEVDGVRNRVNIFSGSGSLNLTSDGGSLRLVGFRGDVAVTAQGARLNLDGDISQLLLDITDSQAVVLLPPDASFSFDGGSAVSVEGFEVHNGAGNRKQIGGGASSLHINPQGKSRVTIRSRSMLYDSAAKTPSSN